MTDPALNPESPVLEIDAHMMHAEVILDALQWQSIKDLGITIKKALHGVNNMMDDDTCCPLSVTITCVDDSAIQTLIKISVIKTNPPMFYRFLMGILMKMDVCI